MTDYIVPILLFLAAAMALRRKENAYDVMLQGASEGLKLLVSILPALILLLTAVYMLRASGAMELLSQGLRPLFALLGIPSETAMLVLVRPLSGSAALAVGADLMAQYGVDSQVGRTAAVMLGSTETTFYTIAVYFGSAGIKKTRYAVPAALAGRLGGLLHGVPDHQAFLPGMIPSRQLRNREAFLRRRRPAQKTSSPGSAPWRTAWAVFFIVASGAHHCAEASVFAPPLFLRRRRRGRSVSSGSAFSARRA